MPRLISRSLLRFKFNQKSYFKFTKGSVTTGGHFFLQKTPVFESVDVYPTLLLVENFFSPLKFMSLTRELQVILPSRKRSFTLKTSVIIEVNPDLPITAQEMYLFPEK